MTPISSDIIEEVARAISHLSDRIRNLESQQTLTPVRYTVWGEGWLTTNTAIGVTTVTLSTLPQGMEARTFYIMIDVGTNDCEVRKVETISDTTVTFEATLQYTHLEGDPVKFIDAAWLNVKDFGAVGNSAVNDATPFQRALNQVQYIATTSNNNTAVVYIPSGFYKITTELAVYNNTSIIGDGYGVPIIKNQAASGSYLFNFGTAAGTRINITIRNCALQGNGNGSGTYGIKMRNSSAINIRDCVFSAFDGYAINASFAGNSKALVRCCEFTGIFGAYVIYTFIDRFTFIDNHIISNSSTSSAMRVLGGYHVTIANNHFDTNSNANYDLYIVDAYYVSITGNVFDSAISYAVHIDGCVGVSLAGNTSVNHTDYAYRIITTTDVVMGGNSIAEPQKIIRTATPNNGFINSNRWDKFFSPDEFGNVSGIPMLVQWLDGGYAWLMPPLVDSWVELSYAIPFRFGDYIPWNWWIYFAMGTGVGGNVRLVLTSKFYQDGDNIAFGGDVIRYDTVPIWPATQLKTFRMQMTQYSNTTNGGAAQELHRLRFGRLGSDPLDTCNANDLYFLGINMTNPNS